MKHWARWLALAVLAWLAGVYAWVWRGPAEAEPMRGEFALVLGAAVADDDPTPVFRARIDHAIALWREGRVQRIVFTGGVGEDDRLSEAAAARHHAMLAGVPDSAILLETRSRTTQQNIAFARPLIERAGGGRVLVVSDDLHLTRAMAMAKAQGLDSMASSARRSRYRSLRTRVPFALREVYFLHHFWLLGE